MAEAAGNDPAAAMTERGSLLHDQCRVLSAGHGNVHCKEVSMDELCSMRQRRVCWAIAGFVTSCVVAVLVVCATGDLQAVVQKSGRVEGWVVHDRGLIQQDPVHISTSVSYSLVAIAERCDAPALLEVEAPQDGDEDNWLTTLGSRDACEATCTSDANCQYYLWKDDPRSPRSRHQCATFAACESRHNASDLAAVYKKEAPVLYKLYESSRQKSCGGKALLDVRGAEQTELLSSRMVCQAACSGDEACQFYLWQEPLDDSAAREYRCASFAECEAVAVNGSEAGQQMVVYRKALANPDSAPVIDQAPVYYTTFFIGRSCKRGKLQRVRGDHPVGILSNRRVCEAACTSDAACAYYLWQDDGDSPLRYACETFSKCNESQAYGENSTAVTYRKEVGRAQQREKELLERRALAEAARLRQKGSQPALAEPPVYVVFSRGRSCVGPVLQNATGAMRSGLLIGRDVCEAACTSSPECQFYLWKDDPGSQERYHCATMSTCPSWQAYGNLTTVVVFQKTKPPKDGNHYSLYAADVYCDSGDLQNWENDDPQGNLTVQETCQEFCDRDSLCSFFMWKDDVWSKLARFRCTTFSSCLSWHPYEDGDNSVIYKKERGQAPVYYEEFLANHDCSYARLQEAEGERREGLLTSREVCEATCTSDTSCAYYLWKDHSSGPPYHCATFAACPSSQAYAAGPALVYRKHRGHGSTTGLTPLPWEAAKHMARRVLAELNVTEKRSLLNGVGWDGWSVKHGYYIGNIPGVQRLGVTSLRMHDSGNGFRTSEQSMVGTVTVWPSPLVLASTWDEQLTGAQAAAIGLEFLGKGANVILGPAINVQRVALGGRNFEYLSGEDPYLGSRLARVYVQGIQRQGVMAVVKHFAFNEQETNRNEESSVVAARTSWELYYPPFQAAIDAGAVSVMCAYNKVNGTYSCENPELLKRDLRGAMGFKGFVMSDWGATHSTSVGKGLDMDQPGSLDPWFSNATLQTVREAQVDQAVRHTLAASYRLRLHEYGGCEQPDCVEVQRADVTNAASRQLARDVATAGVTLLKNDGTLPLELPSVRRIAVVGWGAAAPPARWGAQMGGLPVGDYYSGGGSGHIHSSKVVTALDGIIQRARDANIEVLASVSDDVEAAVQVARRADVVVVVAGTSTSENSDRASFRLDGAADELIFAMTRERPTVVLLEVAGAVLTPWRDNVAAAACLFLGGEATGHAWASVLFGDVSPEGKLPIMMPATVADTIEPTSPQAATRRLRMASTDELEGQRDGFLMRALLQPEAVPYEEGVFTSYRSDTFKAAFPFGHGLSYTTFEYKDPVAWILNAAKHGGGAHGLEAAAQGECAKAYACASVTIFNNGTWPAREVAQAYLEFPGALGSPRLQLRGFWKTALLPPGGHERVNFAFSRRDLSVYNHTEHGPWQLQEDVRVHIGSSSGDIREVQQMHTTSMPPSWQIRVRKQQKK